MLNRSFTMLEDVNIAEPIIAVDAEDPSGIWAEAKKRILRIRARAANAMVDFFDEIRDLRESVPSDSAVETWLQNECGISPRDMAVHRKFHDVLGEHEKLIRKRGVSMQTVKALVATDAQTRAQALRQIEGGLSVDEVAVARIRKSRQDSERSDEAERLRRRRQWVNKAGKTRSHAQIRDLEDAASNLRDELISFQKEFRDYLFDALFEELEESEAYESARHSLMERAEGVLEGFVALFGTKHAALPQWEHLRIVDQEAAAIAQVYDALVRLTQGRFGLYEGFDALSDDRLGGIDSDWMSDRLAYLAGLKLEIRTNLRSAPRPVKVLSSLELCAGAGGEAIGLMAAGFKPAALYDNGLHQRDTLKKNWPRWNVQRVNLKAPETIEEMSQYIGDIDLVSGGVPCQSFSKAGKRRGAEDERQLFDVACDIVKLVKPKAFFFENVLGFLEGKHEPLRRELLKEFEKAGYKTTLFTMKAVDYGLPQSRERVVLLGLRPEYWDRFELPFPRVPLHQSLGSLVGPVIFPFYSGYGGRGPELVSSEAQKQYDAWVEWWLAKYGAKVAPTILGRYGEFARQADAWTEAGFDQSRLAEAPLAIDNGRIGMLPPLTIDLVKTLQGFPAAWTFTSPNPNNNLQMVANAFPPVMARAIGHAVHSAITGEKIDIDAALRTRIIEESRIGVAPPVRMIEKQKRGRPRKHVVRSRGYLTSNRANLPRVERALDDGPRLLRSFAPRPAPTYPDDPLRQAAEDWRDRAERHLYGDDLEILDDVEA